MADQALKRRSLPRSDLLVAAFGPIWRSPEDQPRWARPALLALTVLAGFLYAWQATGNLEIYYAAAVRSMSMSWHNFIFAAFDPAGTISLDKLPGAFWIQALAVRLVGLHAWALIAPQVIEGMATVLVLYRVVRRVASPTAGLLAAAVLVVSPATVALNRGNISDTLMILLALLAADATVSAIVSGRRRQLVWAGVLVGLAFQAKMLEAWLILPALALAYLIGMRAPLRRRLVSLALAGTAAAVVSLSWMLVVAAWPASHRPYVDGSGTNSIFSQVFVYNGFGRLDALTPDQLLTKAIGLRLGSAPPGWDRLLSGSIGRDTAWLIPLALIALVGCLVVARRRRGDLVFAGTVLWGAWLIVLLAVFSASSTINPYYTAALSPPIAALLGTGAWMVWERARDRRARVVAAVGVAIACGYAVWLYPSHGVGLVAGLPAIVLVLGVVAVVLLALPDRLRRGAPAAALAAMAVLAAPALATASIVGNAFGPFDTPFEGAGQWALARTLGGIAHRTVPLVTPLESAAGTSGTLMATQTSALAAPFIYDSGREVIPIGGFTGTSPEPTLAKLRSMIAAGEFHIVIQSPVVTDPRLVWVAHHCVPLNSRRQVSPALAGEPRFSVYYCGRPTL